MLRFVRQFKMSAKQGLVLVGSGKYQKMHDKLGKMSLKAEIWCADVFFHEKINEADRKYKIDFFLIFLRKVDFAC